MSETTEVTTTAASPIAPPVDWQEVAAASAEAQKPDEEIDHVEAMLTVDLTEADIVKMAEDNAGRLRERDDLETRLDKEKEVVKGTKSEIDSLGRKIDECSKSMGRRSTDVLKKWKVITIFATNTERWIDPDSGRVVKENAIPAARRQQDLFANVSPGDDADYDDGGESEESSASEESSDASTDSDRDPLESTTNLVGDPDETEIEIDASTMLEAAPNLLDETPSDETTTDSTGAKKKSPRGGRK